METPLTPRTLPPIELVCSSMQAARTYHDGLARNSMAVAVLLSAHVRPIMQAPQRRPYNYPPGNVSGGHEYKAAEQVALTLKRWRAALEELPRGSEKWLNLKVRISMAEERYTARLKVLESINTAPRIEPGDRTLLNVTVPALHVRIIGAEEETGSYTADLWRGIVVIDADTPGFRKYRHTDPKKLQGRWPLYQPNTLGTELIQGAQAQPWHEALFAELWQRPGAMLPTLLLVPVEIAPASMPLDTPLCQGQNCDSSQSALND